MFAGKLEENPENRLPLDELTDIYVGKKTDVLKSKAAAGYVDLCLCFWCVLIQQHTYRAIESRCFALVCQRMTLHLQEATPGLCFVP